MTSRITSVQNPLVKHLCRLHHQRKCREEEHCCIVEGLRSLSEIDPRCIRMLLVTEKYRNASLPPCEKTIVVTDEVMKKIALTKTPEGVLAEVAIPKEQDLSSCTQIVALDHVQDPGNVGAIFRTCLAFGWDGIVLIEGTCDPFNDKALRAAKGATFKLPYQKQTQEEFLKWTVENNFSLLAASLEGKSISRVTPPPKHILVLGSEGQGISEAVMAKAKPVTIPMSKKIESLNVAVCAGIFLYQFSKVS